MNDSVRLTIGDHGIADLSWQPGLEPDQLQRAVTALAEEALGSGLRRIEVAVPAGDRWARRAVLRSGFRLEGTRRSVVPQDDGSYDDLMLFARLAADVVGGPHGFSGVMNTVLPRKRLIAHVLMRDVEGRILLCDTAFKSDWELPGGIVEPGEAAPRRSDPGGPRGARSRPGRRPAAGGGLAAAVPGLGGRAGADLRRRAGERRTTWPRSPCRRTRSSSVSLLTLEQAAAVVTPLSHRRLSVAVGQADGETAYLQDGRRVGQEGQR